MANIGVESLKLVFAILDLVLESPRSYQMLIAVSEASHFATAFSRMLLSPHFRCPCAYGEQVARPYPKP
jgi:hypothetical protein